MAGFAFPAVAPAMNSTIAYSPSLDYAGVLAHDTYATWVLGPLGVSNNLQTFFGGILLALSFALYREKLHHLQPENKVFLITANVFNLANVVLSILCNNARETSQDRSWGGIWSYTFCESLQPLLQGLVAVTVQCFFARRSQRFLHGEYWVPIFLYPLIMASLVAAVLCTTSNFLYTNVGILDPIPPLAFISLMLWLWSVAATDTAISLVLCVSLWRKKAGSGHRTGNLVNRIIRFSLGTALVTALNAVLAAVLYLVFLDDIRVGLCNIFVTPLPSVYVATLLYALSGWGRSSMPARAGSDPEKAETPSCRFAKALRGSRKTREHKKNEQVDTAVVWSPAAQRIQLDHETPLSEVSFHDVSGLGQENADNFNDDSGSSKGLRGLGLRNSPITDPGKQGMHIEDECYR